MPAYLDTGLNLIHVSDVAEGHLLALEHGRVGEKYILGNQNLTLAGIFALLEKVWDTTLLYRSGIEGLEYARNAAREFNCRGGVDAPGWEGRAVQTHREFVKRNLTCGGVADLLAATVFIQRLEEESCRAFA